MLTHLDVNTLLNLAYTYEGGQIGSENAEDKAILKHHCLSLLGTLFTNTAQIDGDTLLKTVGLFQNEDDQNDSATTNQQFEIIELILYDVHHINAVQLYYDQFTGDEPVETEQELADMAAEMAVCEKVLWVLSNLAACQEEFGAVNEPLVGGEAWIQVLQLAMSLQ